MKKDDNKPKPKAAIEVKSVSKHFKLPHERKNSLKQHFVGLFSKKLGYEKFEALKDISFTVNKGDFFGIVGRNGSGKSTLLKIISGIYQPSSGSVKINGTLTPFIELGIGFNPELTGRENVYLNGSILGLSKKQIDALYNQIVEFAELEKFMDQKLKNYSSGMQVRLAFSIAIRAQNDILLLDEVLAVGDINFQKKCFNYFQELKRQKKTVIFVTHDMNSVKEYCNKAVLINDSKIVPTTDINDVLEKYMDIMNPTLAEQNTPTKELGSSTNNEEAESSEESQNNHETVKNVGENADSVKAKPKKSRIRLNDINIKINKNSTILTYTIKAPLTEEYYTAFSVRDFLNNVCFVKSTELYKKSINSGVPISWEFLNVLSNGKYSINISVFNKDKTEHETFESVIKFKVGDKTENYSSIDPVTSLSC